MVPQAWPHHQEQGDKLLEATLRVLLVQQGGLMGEAYNQRELQEVRGYAGHEPELCHDRCLSVCKSCMQPSGMRRLARVLAEAAGDGPELAMAGA